MLIYQGIRQRSVLRFILISYSITSPWIETINNKFSALCIFFVSLQTWNLLQCVLPNTMRIVRCGSFTGKNLDMFDKNLYMWRLNRLYEGELSSIERKAYDVGANFSPTYWISSWRIPTKKKLCSDAFFATTSTFTRVADIKCLIFKIQFNSLCLACLRCLLKSWFKISAHRVK